MSGLDESQSDQGPYRSGSVLSPTALEGQVIGGDFEIRRKIGQGGMGSVYEAWQRSLRRSVAIKVLANSLSMTGNVVTRFQREAQAAAKLHHPNIVPIYAQGEHAGLYYYAMELVEGRSLNEIITEQRGGRGGSSLDLTETKLVVAGEGGRHSGAEASGTSPDPDDTATMPADAEPATSSQVARGGPSESTAAHYGKIAELMASAADALAYAHRNGVIHRDIKPHNFMYGNDDRLYITDFGLARVLEQPGVTMTGEFVGSPLYMSPEQISGSASQVDHRADIYSLGATLYEWLTLWPPFPGDTREQVISKIIATVPPEPRSLNPETPVDLETICLKALEKSPNRRYANAADMAEDLRRFARRESIRAKRDGWIARVLRFCGRNRAAVLVAGVSLALLSITSAYLSHQSRVRKDAFVAAAERDAQEKADQIESLEAENRRLVDQVGEFPFERLLIEPTWSVIGDVASEALSAFSKPGPGSMVQSPAPPAPGSPTELLVLADRDARLIERLADEVTARLRSSPSNPLAVGRLETAVGRTAEAYYREALDASDPQAALSLVNLAVNTAFDHFDALHLRCVLYLRLLDLDKALADANLLVVFREDASAGYLMRGLIGLLRRGAETLAADLDAAVLRDPTFPACWVARGAVRSRQGLYLQALSDFEHALELAPDDLSAKEEHDQVFVLARYSLRELSHRIEQEPDNSDALIRRGELHHLLGDYASAMADYKKASEVAGETSAGLIYRKWQTQQKLNELDERSGDAKSSTSSRTQSGAMPMPSAGLTKSLSDLLARTTLP